MNEVDWEEIDASHKDLIRDYNLAISYIYADVTQQISSLVNSVALKKKRDEILLLLGKNVACLQMSGSRSG